MHRATRFLNAVEIAIRWPSSLLLIADMHTLCITVRILALLPRLRCRPRSCRRFCTACFSLALLYLCARSKIEGRRCALPRGPSIRKVAVGPPQRHDVMAIAGFRFCLPDSPNIQSGYGSVPKLVEVAATIHVALNQKTYDP